MQIAIKDNQWLTDYLHDGMGEETRRLLYWTTGRFGATARLAVALTHSKTFQSERPRRVCGRRKKRVADRRSDRQTPRRAPGKRKEDSPVVGVRENYLLSAALSVSD